MIKSHFDSSLPVTMCSEPDLKWKKLTISSKIFVEPLDLTRLPSEIKHTQLARCVWCECACVRACVRACVCVCVFYGDYSMEPVKIVLPLMPTNKVFCSISRNSWTGCLFTHTHGTKRLGYTHGMSAIRSASCPAS